MSRDRLDQTLEHLATLTERVSNMQEDVTEIKAQTQENNKKISALETREALFKGQLAVVAVLISVGWNLVSEWVKDRLFKT